MQRISATNFSSGCILIKNASYAYLSDFAAENYRNKGIIESDGSVLHLNAVLRAELKKLKIRGNGNLSSTKGGAIHLSNCRNISLSDAELKENGAKLGGALFIQNTTGQIERVDFLSNKAVQGGGLYVEKSPVLKEGDLTLASLNFELNKANLTGGGAHFEEIYGFTLKESSFFKNTGNYSETKSSSLTEYLRGGAIFISNSAGLLDEVEFESNYAIQGGGIYAEKSLDPEKGNLTFSKLTFQTNVANLTGGAAHFEEIHNFNLTNSVFEENMGNLSPDNSLPNPSYSKGGALYIRNSTGLIERSDFWQNKAIHGGGLYAEESPSLEKGTLVFSRLKVRMNDGNLTGGGAHFENLHNFVLRVSEFKENKMCDTIVRKNDTTPIPPVMKNYSRGGALFIQNGTGLIDLTDFWDNKAMHGGGLYAGNSSVAEMGNLTLMNLAFQRNSAFVTGGGVHFEEIQNFILRETSFERNMLISFGNKSRLLEQKTKGGAIYYSCTKKNHSCLSEVERLNMTNNYANLGGGIYFNNHLFDPTRGSDIWLNLPQEFASSPVQLFPAKPNEFSDNPKIRVYFENGTSITHDEFIKTYFVDLRNFTDSPLWKRFINPTEDLSMTLKMNYFNLTGPTLLQRPIAFTTLDYFGQEIEFDDETNYLKIEVSSNSGSTTNNTFMVKSINGSFIFGSELSPRPGTTYKLSMETNIESFFFNSSRISVDINFKLCDIGEVIPYKSEICIVCPPNSYSLEIPVDYTVTCKSCADVKGLMCKEGGKKLAVDAGYWRYNEVSQNVIPCFTPSACAPRIPNTTECSITYPDLNATNLQNTCKSITGSTLQFLEKYSACSGKARLNILSYCKQVNNGTETGSCNVGYKGVLCAECEEGWGKSKSYECVKCEKSFSFFAQMIGMGLIKIGIIIYTIYQAQKENPDKLHSISLRILITFFQIETMLFQIPLDWPPFFDRLRSQVISIFSSGTTSGYSFECLSYWTGVNLNLSFFESNALYAVLGPALWTVFSGIFLLMRFICKKPMPMQKAKELLLITFLVTSFYFWPAMVTAAFQTLHCFDIGPQKGYEALRLYVDPTIDCSSGTHKAYFSMGIATLSILGFLLPALLWFKVWRNKNALNNENSLKPFGFFIQGYSEQYYYWEFLVLIRKMALVASSVFLVRYLPHMCVTLSVIIGISIVLQLKYSPFKDKVLNKLELNSLFCLAIIAYGSLYHLNSRDKISTTIFVATAVISTIVFFLQWAWVYIGILHSKTAPLWQKLWPGLKAVGLFLLPWSGILLQLAF